MTNKICKKEYEQTIREGGDIGLFITLVPNVSYLMT